MGGYTIEEVLRGVYGEDFHTRLMKSLKQKPETLYGVKGMWNAKDIRLLRTTLKKMRSVWDQPIHATMVDVILAGQIEAALEDGKTVRRTLDFLIRYCFDLHLCSQTVGVTFMGLAKDNENELLDDPDTIFLDPCMYAITSEEKNERIAERMLEDYYPEALTGHEPLDGYTLAERMGIRIVDDDVELGACAKLFVNGADILTRDGRTRSLKPGTIVIDILSCCSFDIENQAIIHECIHLYRDRKHFLLQMLARHIHVEQKEGQENAA